MYEKENRSARNEGTLEKTQKAYGLKRKELPYNNTGFAMYNSQLRELQRKKRVF